VLDHCGAALRQWLKGQVLAMVMIGTLSGLGLWLLGVPSAAALGLIAGLAEFVPFVGPIAGAVLALLVASAQGLTTLLWVLILFLAIQQIEGNLVTPLIERQLVSLPMALTLFSIVAMGVVFGPLGVFLATPLTVLLHALVAKLYVEGVLGRRVSLPGS
jgi:predicted PurR-regulated permease PerM